MYTLQCTLYSVQFTVYSKQCTVYNVHCKLYTIHCTIYNLHNVPSRPSRPGHISSSEVRNVLKTTCRLLATHHLHCRLHHGPGHPGQLDLRLWNISHTHPGHMDRLKARWKPILSQGHSWRQYKSDLKSDRRFTSLVPAIKVGIVFLCIFTNSSWS